MKIEPDEIENLLSQCYSEVSKLKKKIKDTELKQALLDLGIDFADAEFQIKEPVEDRILAVKIVSAKIDVLDELEKAMSAKISEILEQLEENKTDV